MKVNEDNVSAIEDHIRRVFERNYNRLRFESGHALTPEVKEIALQQVILYWRKLSELAKAITETEVRLYLPNQLSAKGKRFGVEGIVDIVRGEGRTVMYDLKTHDPDFIRANRHLYEEQLNVYAYVWSILREQQLSETAIISTQVPDDVSDAVRKGDREILRAAWEKWEPVISINFNIEHVKKTIEEFGEVVDAIESGEFSPPGVKELATKEVKDQTFASRMCRNCDVRFSCSSFVDYLKKTAMRNRKGPERFLLEGLTEEELEERFEAGLT